MRVLSYVYDSDGGEPHVQTVLERLATREEPIEVVDVASAAERDDAIREATLLVKQGVGIGTTPDDLFDSTGTPDFTPGALITEAETGRRSLHVGKDAVEALADPE